MFYLPEDYVSRTQLAADFDDTVNYNDMFQKEVYQTTNHLMRIVGFTSVADIGCGSGYKLIKYLGHHRTVGFDLKPTVDWLKKKHPEREWKISRPWFFKNVSAEVVICADVIEHVPNPAQFLAYIAEMDAQYFIFSTPNRDLIYEGPHLGPPKNPTHYREWNGEEFVALLSDFFEVKGFCNINKQQGTMMVQCIPKQNSTGPISTPTKI